MWSKGRGLFTKDNGGCGLEKSKYPEIYEVYIYAYVSGCLSLPSQMLLGQKEIGLC